MDTTTILVSLGVSAALLIGYKFYRAAQHYNQMHRAITIALPAANQILENVLKARRLPPNMKKRHLENMVEATEDIYIVLKQEFGEDFPQHRRELMRLHDEFVRLKWQALDGIEE